MLDSLIRFLKRLAVLVPVLVIAYLSVFNIFPLLHDELPWVVAAIITYILGAYLLVPALHRLVRSFFPATHLPIYCVTADGFASDPLNIALVGTRQQVIAAMTAAGWHETDPITIKNSIRLILSTVYGWRYEQAPMSHLYLFGRKQDLAFQIPIEDGAPGSRHHVRFWAATYQEDGRIGVRSIHWHNRQAHVRDDRLLWLGAASRDIGVTFIRHTAQLTHLVDPDTDAERELIANGLEQRNLAKFKQAIKLDEPYKLASVGGLRGHLRTDGRMAVLEITGSQTEAADPAA